MNEQNVVHPYSGILLSFFFFSLKRVGTSGNSLVVQWLGLRPLAAEDTGLFSLWSGNYNSASCHGHIPRENHNSKRYMYHNVQCNTIYNSQVMEET